jgi:lipid-A-disaccharide synthase
LLKIFISAGEHSGDLLGARLISALKNELDVPNQIDFQGVGGPLMEREGLKTIFDFSLLSVMGVRDILQNVIPIIRILRQARNYNAEWKPDLIITIDAPEFNLRLASMIKRKWRGAKIVHYVLPSVWAWRQGRVVTLKRNFDHILSILPFEKKFLEKFDIKCDFVGHPISAEVLPKTRNVISFKRKLKIKDSARVVTLLPGSRISELKLMLPIFFETINLLNTKFSDITFVCPTPKLVAKYFRQYNLDNRLKIKHIDAEKMTDADFEESKKSLFACSDLAIVTSGTAVLELAKASVPMIVGYRTSFITEILYRLFVKVHSANLVNLITNSKDIPEFLFQKCSAKNIFKEAQKLLESKEYAEAQLIASKQAVRELGFGSLDPSERAAKSIKAYLKL